MKKREKSGTISNMGKRKVAVEEKRKKASSHTRIGMNFNSKISQLHNQEEVDKYLVNYGFHLNPEIKIEFCLHGVGVSLAPPKMVYLCILRF